MTGNFLYVRRGTARLSTGLVVALFTVTTLPRLALEIAWVFSVT